MKKLILDTDIGVDCDDAVAISLLVGLKQKGFCDILGISTSTARVGATSAVNAILDYYGEKDIPCGKMYYPFLPCDNTNNYAEKLMKKYKKAEGTEESVRLLRRLLANAQEKVQLIAVGPLTMIAKLMQSNADDISPLNGIELMVEKVETFYTMACRFCVEFGEWNVLQDIQSASYVFANLPVPTIVSPGELGDTVFTGNVLAEKKDHPVWDSIVGFFEEVGSEKEPSEYSRESWDPLTCYSAVLGLDDFILSEKGDVSIDERGVSFFTPNKEGKCIILKSAKDPIDLGKKIDRYIF